jgi:hypothetical protein
MANKKALFVGINKFANYSQFTLNGCVNDAKDMAAMYKDLLGFKASEMSTLTDAQATKAAIMTKLKAMVADAKAGKLNYLVFSLSSHGTQMNDTSGDEPDGKDEAFVPYDIAEKNGGWDPAHIISDDELHDLFLQLPPTVLLEVYLDTCHSGSGPATSLLQSTNSARRQPRCGASHSAARLHPQPRPRWPAHTTSCGPAAKPIRPVPTLISRVATTERLRTTT